MELPFPVLFDRLKGLSPNLKLLFSALGIVLLGAALGFFFLLPLWEESNLLQEDINQEKNKLAQITQTKAQISRFKKELAEMDVRYQRILTMLPEKKEIPHLLKFIAGLGHQQGLDFLLFKPEKENPLEYVAEIPISVLIKGPYHQIGLFFDGVRRLPRIVNVRQLELGAFESRTAQVSARCQLVTFRVLPPKPTQPPPKTEKKT